ncbi:unnamed protein product, partial [Symbiodinium sp. CCMP2456]
SKEVPMHYTEYVKWAEKNKGLDAEAALAQWKEYEKSEDIERDELGPAHSKLRLFVPTKDYILREDISGYSKERELLSKAKKNPKDADIDGADEQMNAGAPRWSDEHFRINGISGGTRNSFLFQSGQAGASSKPVFQETPTKDPKFEKEDDPRKQEKDARGLARKRSKKYEELQKALGRSDDDCKKALTEGYVKIVAFKEQNQEDLDSYQHFLNLAEVKLRALGSLIGQAGDGSKAVTLQDLKAGLSEEELTYLPVSLDHLLQVDAVKKKLQRLLTRTTMDDVEVLRKEISADINQIRTLCSAFKSSVNDLLTAKTSRIRDQARAEQREKRKADSQPLRDAKKTKKETDDAALANRAQEAGQGRRIDLLDAKYLTSVPSRTEPLGKDDWKKPWYFKEVAEAPELKIHVESEAFQTDLRMFKKLYKSSPVYERTGRAQCPTRPKEVAESIRKFLIKCGYPMQDEKIASASSTKSGDMVSTFAMRENLTFVASEFECMGQLRLLLEGSRQVIMIAAAELLDLAKGLGKNIGSDEAAYQYFRSLSASELDKSDPKPTIYSAETKTGDMLFTPAGYIVADVTKDTCCMGLRTTVLSKNDILDGNVERLLALSSQSGGRKNAEAFVEAAKALP